MNIDKIRDAWSKETSHPSYADKWSIENPSVGQCAITALYLNREYGYPIYDIMIGRQRHFFNRDKDGKVVDLTSDQFGGKIIDYDNGRLRNPTDLLKTTRARYSRFIKNLNESYDKFITSLIVEGYLDDEHKFYDFHTKDISDGEYIDTTTTGVPHYNSILSAMNNGESYENLTGEIVYMSPEEYYKECATKIFFRSTVDSLKLSRGEADREIIEHLKQVILRFGKRFPLPFINYAARSQEGLHRMLALAELTSWDTKFPVLIVRYADEELARREETQREINNITHKIRMAARDALMYKFYNYEEFKEQLQWSMDKEWQFSDEGTPKYDIIDLNDCFRIAIGEAYYDVDKEDIKIVEPEPNDDLDDVDLDDIEDFLIRHFGDDWEKDFPHLKDTFGIAE